VHQGTDVTPAELQGGAKLQLGLRTEDDADDDRDDRQAEPAHQHAEQPHDQKQVEAYRRTVGDVGSDRRVCSPRSQTIWVPQ
jgi:hypothetical protein